METEKRLELGEAIEGLTVWIVPVDSGWPDPRLSAPA
jgi:hypothetical protein